MTGFHAKQQMFVDIIEEAPATIFSGNPGGGITVANVPTIPFRLQYTGQGSFTTIGEYNNSSKTETITIGTRPLPGTVTFTDLTSITYTGQASTISIKAIDSLGAPVMNETIRRIRAIWDTSKSGYWGPGSTGAPVWTQNNTRMLVDDINVAEGTKVRAMGRDWIVKSVQIQYHRLGLEDHRTCQF